ncbi:MAG: hypothetical protein M1608_06245 [Candidatus Omnitrophica bacterium]|nr:hypothetical protein [Candidatus Omnitrophota bacterium]
MKATTKDPSSISLKEAQSTLAGQLATLDPQRAQGLAGLSRARAAKTAMLERDQRRAMQKYGAQDPRVASLAAQQTLNEKLRAEVAYRAALAGTDIPTVNPNGYTFHGHVLDAKRQPQAGLTVALYDPKGVWIRELGYSCTDARGYFRLDYQKGTPSTPSQPAPAPATRPAPAAESPSPKAAALSPAPGPTDATSTSSPESVFAAGIAAEIRVFDAQQKLLYRSPDTLHPVLGAVDYRLIILNSDGTCASPPDTKNNIPPGRPAKA